MTPCPTKNHHWHLAVMRVDRVERLARRCRVCRRLEYQTDYNLWQEVIIPPGSKAVLQPRNLE